MIIKDLKTLKALFQKIETPILGVGVYAFNRLGLENIVPNYQILALRYSLDTELIEKDIKIFSIEKGMRTKHIQKPRNSTTIIEHKQTKKYLEQFQNPALLVYKPSSRMEKICQENNWHLMNNSSRFGKELFENKIKFRKILEEIKINVPPGRITLLNKMHYGHLMNKYGLPFVIQHPNKGGGKGTFFINNQKDFIRAAEEFKKTTNKKENKAAKQTEEVIVSHFIKGPSPSITGCVTKFGILSTCLQHQILDIPQLYNSGKGSGLFCGHDWTSSEFSQSVSLKAYESVEKIGRYFKKHGYRGIFGLDFILDEKSQELYIAECNPRLLGSFPALNMIQLLNNETPILACHVLEFLNLDYELDIEKINKSMRCKKLGAQMILHNLTNQWALNYKEIKAGIYKLKNNQLEYLRPGYDLKHLKEKEEFLIAEGVPFKKSPFSPNRRISRILTLNNVLDSSNNQPYKHLTPWAAQVAQSAYKSFEIKPVKWVKIKKFLSPNFLAKG